MAMLVQFMLTLKLTLTESSTHMFLCYDIPHASLSSGHWINLRFDIFWVNFVDLCFNIVLKLFRAGKDLSKLDQLPRHFAANGKALSHLVTLCMCVCVCV